MVSVITQNVFDRNKKEKRKKWQISKKNKNDDSQKWKQEKQKEWEADSLIKEMDLWYIHCWFIAGPLVYSRSRFATSSNHDSTSTAVILLILILLVQQWPQVMI